VIGKVRRGSNSYRLLYYLFGPGRFNEHVNPRVIAGYAPRVTLEPPRLPGGQRSVGPLARRLDEPPRAAGDQAPAAPVWHLSMRAAPEDRTLSDAEWAAVAADVMARTGLAPPGDDGACRWVAVRHGDDHIHVVVTLARADGGRATPRNDFYRVGEACQAAEAAYGLRPTAPRDRTAGARPTRGEREKAARAGATSTPREELARAVRTAAAGAAGDEEFFAGLRAAGLLVRTRASVQNPGQVTGYAVARPGDRDAAGEPVWYGGGRLAADLTLPKLRRRWNGADADDGPPPARPGRPAILAATRAAVEATARAVGDGSADEATIAAAGEVADAAARLREGTRPGPASQAAEQFARAARAPWGRTAPVSVPAAALRAQARGLLALGRVLGDRETREFALLLRALANLAEAVADRRAAEARLAQALAAARAGDGLAAAARLAPRRPPDAPAGPLPAAEIAGRGPAALPPAPLGPGR